MTRARISHERPRKRAPWSAAACLLAATACRSDSAATQADGGAPSAPGSRIEGAAGGDLPGALDRARMNDEIVLEAGATFTRPFTLPRKAGSGRITLPGR